jgi:hypothetical protein
MPAVIQQLEPANLKDIQLQLLDHTGLIVISKRNFEPRPQNIYMLIFVILLGICLLVCCVQCVSSNFKLIRIVPSQRRILPSNFFYAGLFCACFIRAAAYPPLMIVSIHHRHRDHPNAKTRWPSSHLILFISSTLQATSTTTIKQLQMCNSCPSLAQRYLQQLWCPQMRPHQQPLFQLLRLNLFPFLRLLNNANLYTAIRIRFSVDKKRAHSIIIQNLYKKPKSLSWLRFVTLFQWTQSHFALNSLWRQCKAWTLQSSCGVNIRKIVRIINYLATKYVFSRWNCNIS